MKYLSYIVALWVLLLSTAPCFLEDKCLFRCMNDEEEGARSDDGCSCADCCSPFLHCNTCTGCLMLRPFYVSFALEIPLNDNLLSFYKEKLIPQFSSSIWQPPKLITI